MWLLSSDNGYLGGKRLWLRPGTSHLLGRTSNKLPDGERVRYIDHKSVSRKQLVIKVHDVEQGDSGRVFKRSGITVTEGSKKGTTINGDRLCQEEKTLDTSGSAGKAFQIVFNSGPDAPRFRLEWKDVTLSFMGGSKAAKANGTALQEEKAKLENADFKLSTDYLAQDTTHVIAKKRNTAQGLQALVQGRWIVTDSWVARLAEVVKRRADGEDGDAGSLLEQDFEKHWPKEQDFIVPTGGEPVSRPNEYFRPDPERADVFTGFFFVFLSQSQHDQLLPVITAGGGKAMLYQYEVGKSKPEEVADFARGLIGKDNDETFRLGQEPGSGGVVVVRLQESSATTPDLESICIAIGQRLIAQNELLDAIVMKDTSNFRTPLKPVDKGADDALVESSSIPRPPADSSIRTSRQPITVPDSPPESQRPLRSAQSRPQTQQQERPQEQEPEERQSYRPRRTITKSRFQGFDDFDPNQVAKFDSDSDSDEDPAPAKPSQAASAMDIDVPSQKTNNTQQNSRKRPAPEELSEDEDTEEQRRDRLLPGQAALKRRRTEALKKGDKSFLQPTPEPETSAKEEKNDKAKQGKTKAKSRVKTESEDIKKLRAKREEEDEQRRLDEEELKHMGEEPIEPLGLDPNVEKFELHIRPPREESQQDHQNPSWNGRKNFKRFRSNKKKDGENNAPRPAELDSHRTYVSLEAIPGKGHGLGDDYWLENGRERARKKKTSTQSGNAVGSQHRQSGQAISLANGTQVLDDAEEETDTQAFRRRVQLSRDEDQEAELDSRAFEDAMDLGSTPSQTMRTESQAGRKRPATQAKLDLGAGAPVAKKPRAAAAKKKTTRMIEISDDDEEEDQMAFKRKRH